MKNSGAIFWILNASVTDEKLPETVVRVSYDGMVPPNTTRILEIRVVMAKVTPAMRGANTAIVDRKVDVIS